MWNAKEEECRSGLKDFAILVSVSLFHLDYSLREK